MNLPAFFLALPRPQKRIISVIADTFILMVAAIFAVFIRLGEWVWPLDAYLLAIILLPLIAIPVFITQGLYRAVIRYIGIKFASTVFTAVTMVFVIWAALIFMLDLTYPRSAIVITWLLTLLLIAITRFLARRMLFLRSNHSLERLNRKNVVIFGAGSAGRQLFNAIMKIPHIYVVGFVDDSKDLHRQEISAAKVYCRESFPKLLAKYNVTDVYLAIPSLGMSKRREIIEWLEPYPVRVSTIPGVDEIVTGKVAFSDIREVDIMDLLGRDPVAPDEKLLHRCITDQVVMITGAGGSIGSELTRQVAHLKPKLLILYEMSEFALYTIEQGLRKDTSLAELPIIAMLGSVRDAEKLARVYRQFAVDTVYHAAAYKHVPIVEHNIAEGFCNNTVGTFTAARVAAEAGVKNFVLISTDKAVRPTNFMGASKRLAELGLQALQPVFPSTRFVMVRFGNVLGSSGSVIPLFRKQIAQGGPVTVTHPEITRFFMTIPEAASLVIQAGSMGVGGDVFVLDMGEPVKIDLLARRVIKLSGLEIINDQGQGDIEIRYTGLRPGEKLFEELLIGDNVTETKHPRIMAAHEYAMTLEAYEALLAEIEQALVVADFHQVRALVAQGVSGFNHQSGIVDYLQS